MTAGPLHVAQDGIYCNLCPDVVYQHWRLALEHMRIEHAELLAELTQPRHLHFEVGGGKYRLTPDTRQA